MADKLGFTLDSNCNVNYTSGRESMELYRQHLALVYKDKEFRKAVNTLKNSIKGKVIDKTKTPHRPNDPRLKTEYAEQVKKLAMEFGVDVFVLAMDIDEDLPNVDDAEPVIYDYDNDRKTINIITFPETTIEDIIKSVRKHYSAMQKRHYGRTKIRVRIAKDYELVYAIYRQRAKGKTFDQIHRLYQDRKLPNYDKYPNKESVEMLKNYYYKYGPKVIT